MTGPTARLLLFIALLPATILAALRWNAGPGLDIEDPVQYVQHARAIAEGRPYRDTGYIPVRYNPGQGDAALPPGIPLLLAGLMALGGGPLLFKLVMMALSLAFFAAAGAYFSIVEGRRIIGPAVALMVGLCATIVSFSPEVQTDLPFCFLVWLLFIAADRPGAWSARRITAITLLGLAAIAVRPLGVVLVPALLGVALVRRREMGRRVFAPFAVMLVLGVAMGLARPPAGLVDARWLRPGQILVNMAHAAQHYRHAVFDALLYPFPWNPANDAWHLFATFVMIVGLVPWVRASSGRLALWFSVGYGTLMVILPFAVARYLWVLFPVMVFGLLNGVRIIAARVMKSADARRPELVAAGVAVLVGLGSFAVIAASPPLGRFTDQAPVRSLFDALRRMHRERPMRVAFIRPRLLAFETGIHAMPLFSGTAVNAVEVQLNRLCITHVVLGTMGVEPPSDSTFRKAIGWRPQNFAREFANDEFVVYRYAALRPDRCPPGVGRP